jgi:putative membrane protein
MWHGGDGMGWWMLWGGLMMLLFWGGIIALIVWTVQSLVRRDSGPTGHSRGSGREETALDIARERYARGDINRDEFVQIKRDLEDH